MVNPYTAEIRMFSFNCTPRGWAACDGQALNMRENSALYSLLGTAFGGDERTTFAVPDLRARAPRHVGDGLHLGSVEPPCATANSAAPEHLAIQFCIALEGIYPSES